MVATRTERQAAVDINEREKAWDKAAKYARRTGQHYVIREYPEFETNIMACVWCDWTDSVSNDWIDDADAQASILAHARTHSED